MLFLAEGFIRRFPDPSMRSRTVLAAPSLARGLQFRPCLLKGFGVGVGDLGHAPLLCFELGKRLFRRHELPQMAQHRMGGRRRFCFAPGMRELHRPAKTAANPKPASRAIATIIPPAPDYR